jgi:transcriptional regulator with XRE-family HTH domain
MLDFGTPLAKCRHKSRLSMQEVTDRLSISRTTYHNWESNKSLYTIDYLPRLAEVFGVEPVELLPPDLKATFHGVGPNGAKLTLDARQLYETLFGSMNLTIQLLEAENKRLREERGSRMPEVIAGS